MDLEDKPTPGFGCNMFDKTFSLKKNLNRHMLVHRIKTYACEQCMKKFRRSDYLASHKELCKKNEIK